MSEPMELPETPAPSLVQPSQEQERDTPVPEKGTRKKKDVAYWDETLGKRGEIH